MFVRFAQTLTHLILLTDQHHALQTPMKIALTKNKTMANKKLYGLGIIILLCICCYKSEARKIRSREYNFKLKVPDQLTEIDDTATIIDGNLFYDTTNGIIMMISKRQSKFKSVDQYIDCSKKELEGQVRNNFGDPELQLISCRKPAKYAKKTTILHFRVSVLPMGYNTYVIYFIHHRDKDIQFSFTYKKASEQQSLNYISSVMNTLKLK